MKQHPWNRGSDWQHADLPPAHKLHLPDSDHSASTPLTTNTNDKMKSPSRIDRELAAYFHPKPY